MRLLVADDDRDSADVVARLLRCAGQEVAVAYGGREAVELAEALCPDVLILDLAMPAVDGIQIANHLRSKPQFADKRFIALTGHTDQAALDAASKAQFDDYLLKPCDFDTLMKILAEAAAE
jgi:CheY-like chemotaxis protein